VKIDYSKYWDRVKFWKDVVENKDAFLGSSPPAVFVGSSFYPRVNIGVLSPPVKVENAGILDDPEMWYARRSSLSDILDFRSRMIFSRSHVDDVVKPDESGKILEAMQELAMSSSSLDVEIKLAKKPSFAFEFDQRATPIGNPAPVEKIRIVDNAVVSRSVDTVISDIDMKTVEALRYLRGKVPIYNISKILSVGLLGVKEQRRIVPTRWSITAVDSNMGNLILDEVKGYDEIDKPTLYHNEYLFNDYQVLLLPRKYEYELVEIDLTEPARDPKIGSDHEPYFGRKTYPEETAGGFYAARVSVLDALSRMRRQATVLIVREVKPEYNVPVGVWEVRETIKGAFDKPPRKFETEEEAFRAISGHAITGDLWKSKSVLYRLLREQLQIERFF
jgi:DNA repair protein NreA